MLKKQEAVEQLNNIDYFFTLSLISENENIIRNDELRLLLDNDITEFFFKEAKVMRTKEDGITKLYFTEDSNYNELVKLLLKNNADINIKDENNETPLDLMIKKNIHIEGLTLQPYDDDTEIATTYPLEQTDNDTITMLGESEHTVKEL